MHHLLSAYLSRHLLDRRRLHRARVLARFKQHKAFDRYAGDSKKQQQAIALADLLCHASRHVPFYRDVLPQQTEDINPQNAFELLQTLPIITHRDIQARPDDFRAENAVRAMSDATGGSTGTPMVFYIDSQTQVAREASLFWANSLTGWNPGRKIAMLWGSDADCRASLVSWRLALRWWIENRRWYNAFDMGKESMAAYHYKMERFQPDLVVAYAGAAFALARFLADRNRRPSYPSIGIVSSAESLLPRMRKEIESVFQCPVFDRYGSREFGAVMAECTAHTGMHINEMDCITELVDSCNADMPNRIIITYLPNRAMPFIRYDTGDLGGRLRSEPCTCGRSSAQLSDIKGRQSDIIYTASGQAVHGEFFTHLLYHVDGVRQFQFVQDSLTRYRLLVVGEEETYASYSAEWKKRILAKVGPESRVEIIPVERIPVLSSGKYKFTVSRLNTAAHD
jgi:phenylacetate-CoA ligase